MKSIKFNNKNIILLVIAVLFLAGIGFSIFKGQNGYWLINSWHGLFKKTLAQVSCPLSSSCTTCINFSANPTTIRQGESSTLSLSVSDTYNQTRCSIDQGVLGSTALGNGTYNFSVSPAVTTTYTASCQGSGGSVSESATVGVIPPPPTGLSAFCPSPGTTATVSWNASVGATSYALRVDNQTNGWSGTCDWTYLGDVCIQVSGTSYSFSSTPGAPYWWWVHACNAYGCSDATGAGFSCTAPPPFVDIKANGSDGPISIPYNTAATISWTSSNASSCSVSPPGWTGTSGSQSTGDLTSSQTYALTCTGPGGSAADSVTVNVSLAPPVSADIKANGSDGPILIPYNTAATISWTSSNASSCSVSPPGWTGTSGSQSTGNLTSSVTYTANCTGPGGSASDSVTVNVSLAPPVSADIKANGSDGPISISYNTAATISWTSSNASSCSVSPPGWTGTSGSQSTGDLTSSQTYALTCTGPGGSAADSVTVNVQWKLPKWKEIFPW